MYYSAYANNCYESFGLAFWKFHLEIQRMWIQLIFITLFVLNKQFSLTLFFWRHSNGFNNCFPHAAQNISKSNDLKNNNIFESPSVLNISVINFALFSFLLAKKKCVEIIALHKASEPFGFYFTHHNKPCYCVRQVESAIFMCVNIKLKMQWNLVWGVCCSMLLPEILKRNAEQIVFVDEFRCNVENVKFTFDFNWLY